MRDINELDEHTVKYFKQVVRKDANTLTKAEKDFLRARVEYLSTDHKTKFESILKKEEKKKEEKTK